MDTRKKKNFSYAHQTPPPQGPLFSHFPLDLPQDVPGPANDVQSVHMSALGDEKQQPGSVGLAVGFGVGLAVGLNVGLAVVGFAVGLRVAGFGAGAELVLEESRMVISAQAAKTSLVSSESHRQLMMVLPRSKVSGILIWRRTSLPPGQSSSVFVQV